MSRTEPFLYYSSVTEISVSHVHRAPGGIVSSAVAVRVTRRIPFELCRRGRRLRGSAGAGIAAGAPTRSGPRRVPACLKALRPELAGLSPRSTRPRCPTNTIGLSSPPYRSSLPPRAISLPRGGFIRRLSALPSGPEQVPPLSEKVVQLPQAAPAPSCSTGQPPRLRGRSRAPAAPPRSP